MRERESGGGWLSNAQLTRVRSDNEMRTQSGAINFVLRRGNRASKVSSKWTWVSKPAIER